MKFLRKCLGCGKTLPKESLLRFAKTKEGQIEVGYKLQGRGAYVCPDPKCIAKAIKPKKLKWALRIQGTMEPSILDELRKKLEVMAQCRS